MDVAVEEAGCQVAAGGVDHARALADAVGGVAHVCHAAAGDRDVDVLLDLAGVDVHEARVLDDGLGRSGALGDGDKGGAALP